jgi:TonB-linked SusC/RagA family outer membrane protein
MYQRVAKILLRKYCLLIITQTKKMLMKKLYRSLGFTLAMLLLLTTQGLAQERTVTGSVTDESGVPMPGINVLVKESTHGTTTDSDGKFSIAVAGNNTVLVFSFVGYAPIEQAVGSRTSIDVQMNPDVTTLQELVFTGYTTERKQDIVGSVAVISSADLRTTPAANLTAQLQGRAPGVTVSTPGQPGAAASVRVRGFTTFGNNNPLFIIDGVPTEDASKINPQDIESIQVLKDATSASIYGARAANGVIIVQTKQGKKGGNKISIDSYYGVQQLPDSSFPKMMNTQEYANYIWASSNNAAPAGGHAIFGNGATPVISPYLIVTPLVKGASATNPLEANPALYSTDPSAPFLVMRTSAGTEWFKEITRPARIQSHQIGVTGGSEKSTHSLGFNYFDQQGTIIHTGYKRATVRANTKFDVKDFIRVGENIQASYEERQGGDQRGDFGAWSQAYKMVPYIPVYDVNGNFAGNGVTASGNGRNPVADLTRSKDNKNFGYGIFGNIFTEIDLLKSLTARSSFGVDYKNAYTQTFNSTTYEQAENTKDATYTEQFGYNLAWTWTNTLKFSQTFADAHSVKVLVGTEAIKQNARLINASRQTYDLSNPDFLTLDRGQGTPRVSNNVGLEYPGTYVETLYSLFARADYGFKDKYLFNATVRRDGSSKFGANNRYAVFPSFGVAWRLSEEPFLTNLSFISDLKLRAGWGQMGSMKNVSPVNQYTTYGSSTADSWYDITGSNSGATVGYRRTRQGDPNTKWETAQTSNIGIDADFADGKFIASLDFFKTETKDLLVRKTRGPIDPDEIQPFQNIGTMVNKGFDASLGYRTVLAGDVTFQANVTYTRYKNEITKLNSVGGFEERGDNFPRHFGSVRIEAGHPMSAFYGYKIDGFYDDASEIANSPTYTSARIGGWKLKDLNGDNVIDDKDRTYIGSPIPDFQMGINLSVAYKNFDLSTFLFWNYGNEIYNFNKYYTHLRGFVGGVSKDVINGAWTESNKNAATLPSLQSSDAVSASIISDYYIESGSYFRAKNVQLGYTFPVSMLEKLKIEKLRIYIQAQNLFTITDYSGADPDINIQNAKDDTVLGMDQAGYPNARQFVAGLSLGF